MLIDECINLLATMPIITNLNKMALMIKMNAGLLAHVISMDIEDFKHCTLLYIWGLLADLANKSGSRERRPINREGLLREAIKFLIVHGRCPIRVLQVIAMWVLALKMVSTNRRVESEVGIVAYVGGQSLGLDMTVIMLIHSIYGFGLGVNC